MALILSLAALQIGLPLLLFAWAWFGRPANRLEWLTRVILMASIASAVAVAGIWLYPAVITSYMLIAVVPALAVRAWLRTEESSWTMPGDAWHATRAAGAGMVAIAALGLVAHLVGGWKPPAGVDVVDLAFPLRDGTYYIANGGSRPLLNAHLATLAPQFSAYVGQSYGVDIIKLKGISARAEGILPADPSRYAIFGEPVYAPCPGTVVAAVDGIADMPVPQVDREHMAGNHVIVRCGPYEVLLGHLQPGTVRVAAGAAVAVGDPIGRVGNTGNSNEPHLHVSVQHPAPGGMPIGGQPVAVTFAGDYLVRNEIVRSGT